MVSKLGGCLGPLLDLERFSKIALAVKDFVSFSGIVKKTTRKPKGT